jgi:RNA recognition motif-containing protein
MGKEGAISKTLPKRKNAKEEEEEKKIDEPEKPKVDENVDDSRLFVENLSYKVTKEELIAHFG